MKYEITNKYYGWIRDVAHRDFKKDKLLFKTLANVTNCKYGNSSNNIPVSVKKYHVTRVFLL